MQYAEAIQILFQANQGLGVKLDLSRMQALIKALDLEKLPFKAIHIAGTNGKGSVSTKISKGLELAGNKVGLFTSPHISTFRERIQINGELISEAKITSYLEKVLAVGFNPTFFEMTTLLALIHFKEEKVDYAVLETGLGGRLDATNVIQPILTIITSIALDHTEILGSDIDLIAKEKAGIFKKNVPVLLGPRTPLLLTTLASNLDCPVTQVQGSYNSFDEENNAIAKEALIHLNQDPSIIKQALCFRPPCRIELVHSKNYPFPVILDVAHNPDGLLALFKSLGKEKLPFIVGLSSSKDLQSCLEILSTNASHLYLVEADSPRAAKTTTLIDILKQLNKSNFTPCSSIQDALSKIQTTPVIAGTFFIMKEARVALGINSFSDPVELNEFFGIVSSKGANHERVH